jgi:16S rRNA processing protein RimM
MTEKLIEIGTVVSPHGIKGEVKIYTNSDFPERFEKPGKRLLKRPNSSECEWVNLKRGYYLPGKSMYVVTLEEVTDRNQAEELCQSKLFVEKHDRPQLEANEYHVDDLIGLAVIDQETQKKIGQVIELYATGNDLLVVELEESFSKKSAPKNRVLIPFVEDIVPIVDINNGRLEVNLPSGLLEL